VSVSSSGTELGDDALMRLARTDDADAFAVLYDRHGARAFRVARAICHDSKEAEEAVEEGFLALWRGRADYQEGGAGFQASVMRIVEDRAIESSRRAARRPPTTSPRDEIGDRPLLAYLRLLPETQAEVIVLAVFGGLTHAQIAAQLDLSAAAVEGRMRLGLDKLSGQMREVGGVIADDAPGG
jgi:RNA polymerase sigma-70 factor (ECF subfamily)